MHRSNGSLTRKLGIAVVLIALAATTVSCSSDDNPVTPPVANRAPGAPTIDTDEGAPANGAVDVPTTINLHWDCSDADGDALSYTVHFGGTNPPASVSVGQSAGNYRAESLANASTFYWKIVAADPDGASTSSPVWSFTTVAAGVETVSAPEAPTGPDGGLENEDLEFSASGAVNSLGHDMEYRFDWGDATMSDWVTVSVQHSWATAGPYDIMAQARCIEHPAVESAWSVAKSIVVSVYGAETVSAPTTPTGPTTGDTETLLRFTTGGAVSSEGHAVQYQFSWGDGTSSAFGGPGNVGHLWTEAGTYEVKAHARCSDHPAVESAYSDVLTVTITAAAVETVSAPDAPGVPATGITSVGVPMTISGGVSSDGHAVQHRVDFGDGPISSWYSSLTTIQRTYPSAGVYEVTVQARCALHPAIESEWSTASTVTISDPDETIPSPPGGIVGVTNGGINEAYDYNVYHSSETNLGHAIEGRFNWGDGTFSDWSTALDHTTAHTWTTEGVYTVSYQARCTLHPEITADSQTLEVTIDTVAAETISDPPSVSYDRYPTVDVPATYTVFGGTSSLGHDVETRFDWGDGSPISDWYPTFGNAEKTWTTAGSYTMTRQSRCIEHPEILSAWGGDTSMNVRDPESVSAPDVPDGPATGTRSQNLHFTVTGAVSSYNHVNFIEYRYDWGDGSALSDWQDIGVTTSHSYAAQGDFEVTAQARCAYSGHDPIESEWSMPAAVSILEAITTSNYNPSGPETGGVDESYEFTAPYATSDHGHTLEYRFDWNDGSYSDWSALQTATHTWTAAGVYDLAYQARCAEHTEAVSEWSYTLELTITADPESITAPVADHHGADGVVNVGEDIWVSATGSVNNWGHPLEFQIDFGDGEVTAWTPALDNYGTFYLSLQHTYGTAGSFEVTGQARCATHPEIVSPLSTIHTIEVYESLTRPEVPTGPLTGTVGENLTYTTTGSTSSEGHALEYRFEYRQGLYTVVHLTDWSTSLTDTHVFSSAGSNYRVRVYARCIEHTEAEVMGGLTAYITITD
jgi:hypothetical protein